MSAGRRRALVATALALAALGACGRRGPPVAPEHRAPQVVGDLTAATRAGAIDLTWTVPRRRADNSRIVEPGVARLFRVDDAGTGEPRAALLQRDRVRGYTEITAFRLDDPAADFLRGNQIHYTDRRDLVFGRRYTYVVTTSDASGRTSLPSSRVSVTYIAAPAPPQALRAEPGDRAARLTWQAPAMLADGSPISDTITYEVLRAGDATSAPAAVGRTESGVTSFQDRGLANDQTYYYAVRAIRAAGAATAVGEAGDRVAVTPAKTTAPSPVTNVVAIPSRGEVRLSWQPSSEPDIAAYVVYRAAGTAAPIRVGAVRPPMTTFVDRNVPSGTYRYTVRAQDTSARANESAPSNEVSVTVP